MIELTQISRLCSLSHADEDGETDIVHGDTDEELSLSVVQRRPQAVLILEEVVGLQCATRDRQKNRMARARFSRGFDVT